MLETVNSCYLKAMKLAAFSPQTGQLRLRLEWIQFLTIFLK